MLATVARSDALTLISKTAMSNVARWNLKALPIPELTWQRAIGLLRRDEAYAPPAVGLLIRHVKRAAERENVLR
jgi:DNA-binding transcriptional LysR family regulator